MSFNIKNNVFWVGKTDWELRKFHGDEYSTHRGSTYNAYLIKEEKAAAFGCYGWSGESIKIISGVLEASGFDIIDEGLRVMWNPDDEGITKCVEFGKKFATDVSF